MIVHTHTHTHTERERERERGREKRENERERVRYYCKTCYVPPSINTHREKVSKSISTVGVVPPPPLASSFGTFILSSLFRGPIDM
mmetsp:Transcript_45103/g.72528  ORF Transcript_45103/g.72528 Transcript_45103/m.72528 type:complete len:86 (+) Transcript_45103:109-366(+)